MPRAGLVMSSTDRNTNRGLDLPESPRVNSPVPELLPDGAWTDEKASGFLRNMEGKMEMSMVHSSISTESSRVKDYVNNIVKIVLGV